MATTKKEETAPAAASVYDFADLPPTTQTSVARIETAGIHDNLKVKLATTSGKWKDKKDGTEHIWKGFEVTLTDPDGLEFTEVYFAPPSDVKEIDVTKLKMKMYEPSDGKMVETRMATAQETLIKLNNEFISYLIDLGDALGYPNKEVQEMLMRNSKGGFDSICKTFIEKFKPSDIKRVSAKILWSNSDKQETSYLKIHGSYPKYYPFGADLFDVYVKGKPTKLKLNTWENKNGMVKKYTTTSDAPKQDGKATGNTSIHKEQGGYKAVAGLADDDLF